MCACKCNVKLANAPLKNTDGLIIIFCTQLNIVDQFSDLVFKSIPNHTEKYFEND